MMNGWQWDPRAPFSFGCHPGYEANYRAWRRKIPYDPEGFFREEHRLSNFTDSRHPEVTLIPRDRAGFIVDDWGDGVDPDIRRFPFSSYDFHFDADEDGTLFFEFDHSAPFARIWGINQLAFLVPPRPKWLEPEVEIFYISPQFPHTRWEHSVIVAALAEVILARNGFSRKGRNQIVLACGSHDIATPAGGDSVKRIDPLELDEERNYSWVMEESGLAKRWKELYGFKLAKAQQWVEDKGVFGRFLDVLDKIAYTSLDCYQIGRQREGKIRELGLEHPLVMDVWQDIVFSQDKRQFAFTNPERLFLLLLFRAYEFQEFLYNPYSRTFDFHLRNIVLPLYRAGEITREDLLSWDDDRLFMALRLRHLDPLDLTITQDELAWKKFQTKEEQEAFAKSLGSALDHTEYMRRFRPGLDWPVWQGGETKPLRSVFPEKEAKLLEELAVSTEGYYVYYQRR